MWKKDDVTNPKNPETKAEKEVSRPPEVGKPALAQEPATIGPSITVSGEVSGDEDLLIQGRVEGSVDLKENSVTVGQEGRVKADIRGRLVAVEGEVEGNLDALERVVLHSSARVRGDITAPRVVLEDGATFRGLVDMGDPSDEESGKKGKGGSEGPALKGSSGTSSSNQTSSGSGDAKKAAGGGADAPEKKSSDPNEDSTGSSTKSSR